MSLFNFSKLSLKKVIAIFIFVLTFFNIFSFKNVLADDTENELKKYVENIFLIKSKAVLTQDLECLKGLYCNNTKIGKWAYEYEEKKVKYINNWAEKQGVKFLDIIPKIKITRCNVGDKTSNFYILCDTEYKYEYLDQPNVINSCRIGTSHIMRLSKCNDGWIITKEWYSDPFADSLSLENIKVNDIKDHIKKQSSRDFSELSERRKNALEYAEKYCGVSVLDEYKFKYNRKYKNFNCEGGDCANFASQILHEGGKFRKNSVWNYAKGSATGSWVNADKFTHYMLNSGRASVISTGSYEKVYKASYKLLPGDFIAYEKKGDITHISVVTGADSKGYSLVTCHNTDRNNVPWDLGWSDKKMKFWLIRVHY
ncbi:amidase domain-containing protein [Clostridium taeniosporum]|uniref:Amidase domain-containing protein n=1 Tax=Clostridium taeniosporum TaxID=394958 RepID=A0A1D7XJX6_9CLOT|nr:amidase domain-containing protein [Clostridium taeniosporum]AOR23638.1 amidase domain-containing protein [Clostridium taeniosporum]